MKTMFAHTRSRALAGLFISVAALLLTAMTARAQITGVTLAASPAQVRTVGAAITLSATLIGSGSPSYQFLADNVPLGAYGPSASCVWTPSTPGTHLLKVKVKDATGPNPALEFAGTANYLVAAPLTAATLAWDASAAILPSQTKITLAVSATGGASLRYQFKANGTIIQAWSVYRSFVWAPYEGGDYTITAEVKDLNGIDPLAAIPATSTVPLAVTILPPLKSVSVTPATPSSNSYAINQSFTLTAVPNGGTTVRYRYLQNGVEVRGFDASPTYVWTPPALGQYLLTVEARDLAAIDPARVVSYNIAYTITNPVTDTTLGTKPAPPFTVGTPIVFDVYVTGGARPVYEFWINGVLMRSYFLRAYYVWTPTVSGAFTITAKVKDLGGADPAYEYVITRTYTVYGNTPTQLAFDTQPSTAMENVAIAPPVTVRLLDQWGSLVPVSGHNVTLSLETNPVGGTLSGTLTAASVNGVATFDTLSIDKMGNAYRLAAASTGTTGATSSYFDITRNTLDQGVPAKLVFDVQPTNTVAGAGIAPAVTVKVVDASGALVTDDNVTSVTMAIGTNPGGGTLSGARTVTVVNGVATFSGLSIDKVGKDYTLFATAEGLTPAYSNTFDITPGAVTQLTFVQQPTNTVSKAVIVPWVTVGVADAYGNLVTGDSTTVINVAIGFNPSGGILSGTTSRAVGGGQVGFSSISIDKAGNAYTLTASAAGLPTITSNAFNITPGAPASLVFGVQPSTTAAGASIAPAVTVRVLDSAGNLVTTSTMAITMRIAAAPGAGATLYGTTTVNAVGGIATFSALNITIAGNGYQLGATGAAGVATAVSDPFNIIAAAPATIGFYVQPIDTKANIVIQPYPSVRVLDTYGNVVANSGAPVTVAIGTNPGGATLSGTLTVNAINGLSTFSNLTLNKAGAGYTLTAASPGMTTQTSVPFAITSAPQPVGTQLAFGTNPVTTVAGNTMAAVTVRVLTAAGALVTTDNGSLITLTFGVNAGGGTLTGTLTQRAVAGVATFNNLMIDKTGTGYTFSVTSPALTGATSTAFNITPNVTAAITFGVEPSNTVAGTAIAPAVTVQARDAWGNVNTNDNGTGITVAIGTNPGGGTLTGTLTRTVTAGVATFSGLSIDKTGAGYTLAATAGAWSTASSAFAITAGPAVGLKFLTTLGSYASGAAFYPYVDVAIVDAHDNWVTDVSYTITLALSANPAGATLLGSVSRVSVGGGATFRNIWVDKVGTGYTLVASVPGLTSGTSNAFTITPGPAHSLSFDTQPSTTTAGQPISPAVVVHLHDYYGNDATTTTKPVTLAIGANPAGGTLSGTKTVTPVSGIATFSNLSIDKVGAGYTLNATGTSLVTAASSAFNITLGAPARMTFDTQPVTTIASATMPPVVVHVVDAAGNPITGDTRAITLAIIANPGGGTLSGTTTVNAIDGVATFTGLAIEKTGVGYRLQATAAGLAASISAGFNIVAGTPVKLGFITQPSTAVAGNIIAPAVTVAIQDANGNTVTTASAAITLAIGANPGGGTLSGTKTATTVNGVASFSDLKINRAATGYTLQATGGGYTAATSAAFNINIGLASRLVFPAAPANTAAATPIAPPVVVWVADSQGNLVSSAVASVTVAIGTNPVGGVLSGTKTAVTSGGVATFSNLQIDRSGIGYTLKATTTALTQGVSPAFNITASAATHLNFSVQPSHTTAGQFIAPAIKVSIVDALDNVVTTDTNAVTLSLGDNPGGSSLYGTLTVNAVAGVATFSDIWLDKAATGYNLYADTIGLTGAESAWFNVLPDVAAQLHFVGQPSDTAACQAMAPAVTVEVQDVYGNRVTTDSTTPITLSLSANPSQGVLSGTLTRTAVNGLATFANLVVDHVGDGYAMRAADGLLVPADSNAFNIVPGPAAKLVIMTEPADWTAGVTMPAFIVQVQDACGNRLTGDNGTRVTVAFGLNPGGATLSGTKTVTVVNGIATFGDLSITKAAVDNTLVVTATGLPAATSTVFNIAPAAAAKLVFSVQPTTTVAGSYMNPVPTVQVQDAYGNLLHDDSTTPITIAIGNNPVGGTLSGQLTRLAGGGIDPFRELSIDKAGPGYTLTATAPGLAGAVSSAFDITPGPAHYLAFAAQPTLSLAGATISPAPTVQVRDSYGNLVSGATMAITVSLGANPGNATLMGTTTVNAVNGIATFANLQLDKVGTGYTLVATDTGVVPATSETFAILPGAPVRLAWSVPVASTKKSIVIQPYPRVVVLDAYANQVTGATNAITVAIGTNAGGGTLAGTLTQTAVGGEATFDDLMINNAGTGYTLVASTAGLTAATSPAFNITATPQLLPAKLAFSVEPTTTAAGAAMATVTVQVLDYAGALVTADNGTTVQLGIGINPGGSKLSGTIAKRVTGGVASFTDVSLNKVGVGYTLNVSSPYLLGATSTAFNITPGPAYAVAFAAQPVNTVAGATITPAVTVHVLDAWGNLVTTDNTTSVTVAIGENPSGGTLAGTKIATAAGGVATFAGLSINKTGIDYNLTATAAGMASASSEHFDITPGAPAALVFTQPPTNVAAGFDFSPNVQINVHDALGNLVNTDAATVVTMAIGNNAGGGTLLGSLTRQVQGGFVSFRDLYIDKVGTGYTLTASAAGLPVLTSSPFNIMENLPERLRVLTQPAAAVAGQAIAPTVQIEVIDDWGNRVTTSTAPITIDFATNPGGGTLSGTTTVNAVNGVATFTGLSIDRAGTGYTLKATAGVYNSATTNAFNVTAGAPATLAFGVQPTTAAAGATLAPAPTVRLLDAFGNLTTSTAPVTVSFFTNPGGVATLGGTLTVSAVNGTATFGNLSVSAPGTRFSLKAAGAGLTTGVSALFTVTAP